MVSINKLESKLKFIQVIKHLISDLQLYDKKTLDLETLRNNFLNYLVELKTSVKSSNVLIHCSNTILETIPNTKNVKKEIDYLNYCIDYFK